MTDVLLVLASSTGGVGQHVRSLALGLSDRGHRVRVSCPPATQQVFDFPGYVPGLLGRLGRLGGVEVVHAHGLRAGVRSVAAGLRPGSPPLVVTWHNAQLRGGRAGAWAETLVARRARVTLAASSDLAETARARGARDVRLGPVAAPALVPTGDDPGLGHPLVLAVGRLHAQKGYEVLLDALPLLGPDVTVAVAGDGPLAAALAARAPQVRWLGRRTDVADLYAAADVVVLPSVWEARSLTAQEALLAGRPLVATAVGGLPELLGDGALLVPPGDAAALAAAVCGLLEDPAAARQLAERGREVARLWPTEQDTLDQVEALYCELTR